ncbi:BrnT family toxin [Desulfobulbus sp.]|uniref:BrnT family toxin n=1 Tax=Desulfobulbus sp. TaxID=895 RepID=UPI00286EC1ED|nr:BrnT family toxin [Desulfobulbus sp.]
MEIEFDQDKRDITLRERGLDFADAAEVFAGPVLTGQDTRQEYGEPRFITMGVLDARLVVLVWTPRGPKRRIISMRHANDRERKRFERFLG